MCSIVEERFSRGGELIQHCIGGLDINQAHFSTVTGTATCVDIFVNR